MPIITIKTNSKREPETIEHIQKNIVSIIATELHKKEESIQVIYTYANIWMANNNNPAAFVEIRFVKGLTPENAAIICQKIANLFQETFSIDVSRLYINFIDIPEEHAWRFCNGEAVSAPKQLINEKS